MIRAFTYCAAALLISVHAYAQENHEHGPHCGHDIELLRMIQKYPEVLKANEQYQKAIEQKLLQKDGDDQVYIIPLVFHVLHNFGPENISDAQIYDEIRLLNEYFRKQRPDTVNTIPEFQDLHADTRIEFRLASKAPDGSCSNGINRISTANVDDDFNIKGLFQQWPRHVYLNVWVVRSIAGGTLGYATKPGSVSSPELAFLDGIVVEHDNVGSIGTSSSAILTRPTFAHECGHILNLDHPWGATNEPGVACGDDGVEDTPVTQGRFGCPSPAQAQVCNPGIIENFQNYMDYTSCQTMFTLGQKDRMRATLSLPDAGRSFLVSAQGNAIAGVDVDEPALCNPVVDFYPDRYYKCTGQPVTFSAYTKHATPTFYDWDIPGVSNPDFASNESSATVTFDTPGWKTVSLTAGNSVGSSSASNDFAIYIYDNENTVDLGDPSLNYQQTFWGESDLEGYTIRPANENSLIQGVNWGWSPIGCFDQGSIRVNSFDSPTPEQFRFVTPKFNMEGRSGQKVSFRYAYATQLDPNMVDVRLAVRHTSNCGNTIVEIFSISDPGTIITGGSSAGIPFEPNSTALWKTASFNISPGQAINGIQYEFILDTDFGVNNFYIDNLTIGASTVSVEDEGALGEVNLYPNPAKDFAQVDFTLNQPENVSVRIFDITGKQVKNIQGQNLSSGQNNIRIETGTLASGMYTVKLIAGSFERSLKLLVQP